MEHNYTKFHISEYYDKYIHDPKAIVFSNCGLLMILNEPKLINDCESFMYNPCVCKNCERVYQHADNPPPDPPKEYQITIRNYKSFSKMSISFDFINEFMGLIKFAIDIDTKFEQGILL